MLNYSYRDESEDEGRLYGSDTDSSGGDVSDETRAISRYLSTSRRDDRFENAPTRRTVSPPVNNHPEAIPRMQMFDEAFLPVCLDEGTPYPVAQSLLDKALSFSTEPRAAFVHPNEAVADIVWRNKEDRRLTTTESNAIDRLSEALQPIHQMEGWSPDIFIKMFPDIDTVFFGGALLGNVLIKWESPDSKFFEQSDDVDQPPICVIEFPQTDDNDLADGQCRIWINAENVFMYALDPFNLTWMLLMNKLVDAYLVVRPVQDYLNDPYGPDDKYHRMAL
ncbi:hypothetical protein P7C71_g2166, partial [Lecanoromycetidae sp. Uapishka_2]